MNTSVGLRDARACVRFVVCVRHDTRDKCLVFPATALANARDRHLHRDQVLRSRLRTARGDLRARVSFSWL